MMTLENIVYRLAEIYDRRDDDETAHVMEDKLMIDFIKYISEYGADKHQKEMAKMVLKSGNINFSRWYA